MDKNVESQTFGRTLNGLKTVTSSGNCVWKIWNRLEREYFGLGETRDINIGNGDFWIRGFDSD